MGKRRNWVPPVIFGIAVLVLWIVVTETGAVGPHILPRPIAVVDRLVLGFSDGYLLDATLQTLSEALLGCLFAALIGIPIGFLIAHVRLVSVTFEPYLAASQAIPAVAIAPLLVTWIGYGTTPIVALCVLMVIFPIIINTAAGLRGLDQDVIGAARLDGAGGLSLLWHIELPLAAPAILAGIRTGFTLSITGAVVGEMVIGGRAGLGIQLTSAQHLNDIPGMFATIVILAVSAVALYLILRAIENRVVEAVS